MQKFNYHSHTKRCGHAIGEDEEYVLAAIANGYTKMAFQIMRHIVMDMRQESVCIKKNWNSYMRVVKVCKENIRTELRYRSLS